jgi:ribosomal protein S18 acetylase RimI-like enzyme
LQIRILGAGDHAVLTRVADGVFDYEVDPGLSSEFLQDPRHHVAVAIEDGAVIGMVSAVHYIHPDKPPELWINEVGVAPSHQRRGAARQLLRAMFRHGADLGCRQAWVLTDTSNTAALRLYASMEGSEPPEDTVMFTFRLDAEGGWVAR